MPPKQPAKQAAIPVQDKENIDPATLSKRMQRSRDKRKVEKRNQLQEKFDKDMDGMKENIDKFFDRAADESASRHVDFTTRLMELIMKRGDIEAQIIRHSQIVEHAYYDANKELGEILRGKLADIEAGPVTPKATRSADLQSS